MDWSLETNRYCLRSGWAGCAGGKRGGKFLVWKKFQIVTHQDSYTYFTIQIDDCINTISIAVAEIISLPSISATTFGWRYCRCLKSVSLLYLYYGGWMWREEEAGCCPEGEKGKHCEMDVLSGSGDLFPPLCPSPSLSPTSIQVFSAPGCLAIKSYSTGAFPNLIFALIF